MRSCFPEILQLPFEQIENLKRETSSPNSIGLILRRSFGSFFILVLNRECIAVSVQPMGNLNMFSGLKEMTYFLLNQPHRYENDLVLVLD